VSVISKLHFNSVELVRLEDGLHPHLICPVCKRGWIPNLSFGTSFPAEFDVNRAISFTAPSHINMKTGVSCLISNRQFTWFIAVHRGSNGVKICIQKSIEEGNLGIPANWWMRP
jgi:hypothetical protein